MTKEVDYMAECENPFVITVDMENRTAAEIAKEAAEKIGKLVEGVELRKEK